MNIKKIHIGIVLLFLLNAIQAQQAKVLVTNDENSNVLVKWYTETVFTDNAVNIYRQLKGENTWNKLNKQAVKRNAEIPNSLIAKDQIFSVLENTLSTKSANEIDGFTKFIIMIKSVEYPEFSSFLGLQYVDKKVEKGQEYRYKIVELVNGKEKELVISDWISSATYKPIDSPKMFTAIQKEYSITFNWIPDENIFMGVYLYRSINNGQETKLSNLPIILSKDEQGNYPEIFFTDDSLQIGETYNYQIAGIDYFGRESELSPTITITIKDITPPPPPTRVKTIVMGKMIMLLWQCEKVADLSGFNIYKTNYDDTSFVKINKALLNTESDSFMDSVSEIDTYKYKVSALDLSGNESFSEVYSAEIMDIFPPTKPESVVAVADTGKVTLNWKANKEDDLAGYLIYRTVDTDKKAYLLLNAYPVKANNYVDSLPKMVKNYFLYKIIAIDTSYNKSEYSDFAITRLPDVVAPQKPVIKRIAQENNSLVIEWNPVLEPDIAGYNIFKIEEGKEAKQLNVNLIRGINLFTDRMALPNTKNNYYVIAIDSSGNQSEKSDIHSAQLNIKEIAELEFKNITASYKSKKKAVQLNWTVKTDGKLKGFVVYRKVYEHSKLKPISGLIQDPEFLDKKIKAGETYEYQVRVFTESNDIIKSETKKMIIQ